MTERLRLSHKVIEALPVPSKARVHVYDAATPGLAVCLTPAGRRIFYWLGRVAGHPTRIQIGQYPAVPLEAARVEAKRIAADAATGVAPRTRKKRAQTEPTLLKVFQHFLEHVSKPHKKTWERDVSQFDRTLVQWKHLPLSRITKTMVSAKHVALGESAGPYGGNKMLELLRTLYSHAINHLDWTGANPVRSVKRFSVQSRDRFLDVHEIGNFLNAVSRLKRDTSRDFFMLCLFTGARRVNVETMRWSEISMERREWRIPDTSSKNKKPIVIALTEPAMEILERRKQSAVCDWVLPGQGATGHVVDHDGAWRQILKYSGLTNLRIHDLRRTLGSWQAMHGSSLSIIAKSLGHTSVRATEVYARLQMSPVRESVEAATNAMLSIAHRNSEISKNAVSFPEACVALPDSCSAPTGTSPETLET